MSDNVQKWLLEKYNRWQEDIGERVPEWKFAEFLGVGSKALNRWMNGKNNPSYKSALKIAEQLNDFEIMTLLGFEMPIDQLLSDDQLAPIANLILQFPEEVRPQIRTAIAKVLADMIGANEVPTEEETLKLMAEKILSEIENQ